MFKNLKQATIIADAKFHLPLYEKLTSQQGNCLHTQVISLDTFISQYIKFDTSKLELLYLYKEALEDLDSDNAFYTSRMDADFLKACLTFLQWANTYGMDLSHLCDRSQKEKDLKEILDKIKDIPLKETKTQAIFHELQDADFSHVYILKKEFSDMEYVWVKFLLEHKAHLLYEEGIPEKHYIAVANARLQAMVVCEEILSKDMDANDIQISISNPSDLQALLFILQNAKIPYTLLSNPKTSKFSKICIAMLNWLMDKSYASFLNLIHLVYRNKNVETYLQLFPHAYQSDFSIQDISYQENNLIDQMTFESYQQLERCTMDWMDAHHPIFTWDFSNVLEAMQEIQTLYPNLSTTDHAIIRQIFQNIRDAYPHIHTKEDLAILIDAIDSIRQNQQPESMQGILIGTHKDITSLRPIHFLLSASAKEFPNLETKTGIFDETYIQNTDLPSLEARLNFQNQQIIDTLNLAKVLYCIVPQSTYDSKSLEESMQLNAYMGCKPIFRTCVDSNMYTRPKFEMKPELARSLFMKHNQFTGSISRLETFGQCPFKHFIRYGLHLKEPREWNDIAVRGTILHHILEVLATKHGKDYVQVPSKEIQEIINEEFAFAQRIFPNKKGWFKIQALELTQKIQLILEQLHYFESHWHMQINKQEQKFSYSLEWDDFLIELYGYIDRIDTSSSSFCIFDYKSSDKDVALKDFEAGLSLQLITYTLAYQKESGLIPAGSFYISLKTSPQSHIAAKPGYRKKLGDLTFFDEEALKEAFVSNKKLKGLMFQDLSIYTDEELFAKKKDVPSFETLKEEQEVILKDMIQDILSGNIKADHDKNACRYCSYASICRNAQNEVEKMPRIQKEEA